VKDFRKSKLICACGREEIIPTRVSCHKKRERSLRWSDSVCLL